MAHSRILDIISSRMQCPVCYDVLHPPIHACKNKHGLCGDCYDKLKLTRPSSVECPICRSAFDSTSNYGQVMERVYSMWRVNCKYIHYGCPAVLCGSCMKIHMENCEKKPTKCPWRRMLKCIWEGPENLVPQHCFHEHPEFYRFVNPNL